MSYQVLARKWRPRTFDAVVGQQPALTALQHALDSKKIHHAYLFTGTRGVGKTTLARIFAKCLSCEQGISSKPCEGCEACRQIDLGQYPDVIEIDAASRTKVEDTRVLLENIVYSPVHGRFKIYLIDEVHMLSTHSFNALLKTLEEPPEHVKFLLATTDPQKLPITVLSRCLQFHLRKFSKEQLVDSLEHIVVEEQISFEAEALHKIAEAAAGSLRDGLSLLEQVIALGQGQLRLQNVIDTLGMADDKLLLALITAIIQAQAKDVLKIVRQLESYGVDFAKLLTQLQSLFHQMVVFQVVPDSDREEEIYFNQKELKSLAAQVKPDILQLYYQIAVSGQKDLPYMVDARMGFEMIALRMIAFCPVEISPERINSKLNKEVNIEPQPAAVPVPEVNPEIEEKIEEKPDMSWAEIIPHLKLMGLTKLLAEHCTVSLWDEHEVHLQVDEKEKHLLQERYRERVQSALSDYLNRKITVKITMGTSLEKTPYALASEAKQQAKEAAQKEVNEDEGMQQLIQTFDATVNRIEVNEE